MPAPSKIHRVKPLPDDAVHEWAQIAGVKVCFERRGNGPPLVLVHGLLAYSFSWRFMGPAFAEKRQVFAVDMPGSGFSDCSRGLDCRLRSAAQRLLAFLDAVGVSRCDLIGSSYGGATAMMAAALAPTRFRTLILVSPANPWSRFGRKRIAVLKNPVAAAIFPVMARPFRGLHAYFHRRMYGDPARVASDTMAGYERALARPGVIEHAVAILRSWRADMQELHEALPSLAHIPTLLVWGDRDRVVDPASAELLRQHLPHAELVVMPGVGHLPYEEVPEDFGRVGLNFLSRNSPPAVPGGK